MDIKELGIEIMAAAEVRRSFVDGRDIRGDVEFQNDVNALLARVEHLQMPWRSLSDLSPSPLASAIVADNTPLPVRRPGLVGIGRLPALVVASVAPRGSVAPPVPSRRGVSRPPGDQALVARSGDQMAVRRPRRA